MMDLNIFKKVDNFRWWTPFVKLTLYGDPKPRWKWIFTTFKIYISFIKTQSIIACEIYRIMTEKTK